MSENVTAEFINEQCVLGSVLADSGCIDAIDGIMSPKEFGDHGHRVIYQTMQEMYQSGKKIDPATLGSFLKKKKELEQCGGQSYLDSLIAIVYHAFNADTYAGIVHEAWQRREIISTLGEGLRDANDGSIQVDDLLARTETRLHSLSTNDTDETVDLKQTVAEVLAAMSDRSGGQRGIPTGYQEVNDLIGGWREGRLTILAARPSIGKTALATNFATALAKRGIGVMVFSLEMTAQELTERILCCEAGVPGHMVEQGKAGEPEQHSLSEACAIIPTWPLYIDDFSGIKISQICARVRRGVRRHGIKLVVIDYLQLVTTDEARMPREQQVSDITRKLKNLAQDSRVQILALSQLNREVEKREDKRPRLSDLRESGAIEQDANVVMFLHRPELSDSGERPSDADVIVAKNRHGQTGTATLRFNGSLMRFRGLVEEFAAPSDGF